MIIRFKSANQGRRRARQPRFELTTITVGNPPRRTSGLKHISGRYGHTGSLITLLKKKSGNTP